MNEEQAIMCLRDELRQIALIYRDRPKNIHHLVMSHLGRARECEERLYQFGDRDYVEQIWNGALAGAFSIFK